MPDCHYFSILQGVLNDARHLCPGYKGDYDLDLKTVAARMQHEGDRFLTITLPKLKKHFLRAIELGAFTPLKSFKKRTGGGSLPCFMHGLYNAVFDESGIIKDAPCTQSIRVILQITSLFSKLEGVCDADALKFKQIKAFASLDKEIENHVEVNLPLVQAIADYATDIVHNIFVDFSYHELCPKPGSGAEANSMRYYMRWVPSVVPYQTEKMFPFSTYHFVNDRHLFDAFDDYMNAEIREDIAARLEAVPKTTEAWRLICVVANGYMFLQQGMKDLLYDHLEHNYITRGHVNFTDQDINGKLAFVSSATAEYATLDMKDASDRVTKRHVIRHFARVPHLRDALLALSENSIALPTPEGSRSMMACNKYAPMGSALCFPVMSTIHYALVRAIVYYCAHPHNAIKHSRDVYVYGDDLIVRSEYANDVIEYLEIFGLKINADKCFIKSKFRESCGIDAFDGVVVTPTRVKTPLTSLPSVEQLSALFQYEWDFFSKGFRHAARALRVYLRQVFVDAEVASKRGPARRPPFMTQVELSSLSWRRSSPKLIMKWNYWIARLFGNQFVYDCPDIQNLQISIPLAVAKNEDIELEGWLGLFQYLSLGKEEPDRALVEVKPNMIVRKRLNLSAILGRSYESRATRVAKQKPLSVEPDNSGRCGHETVPNRPRDRARRLVRLRWCKRS